VEATVEDGTLRLAGGTRLPLPRAFAGRVSAGDRVTFGLRPDDLSPTGHGIHSGEAADVHRMTVPVSLTEPLGNETLVFTEIDGRDWVARMLNPRPLAAGQPVEMSLDLSQAHLFSAETGRSLRG
jgi:multiple sugar transport system ATP-binding protein